LVTDYKFWRFLLFSFVVVGPKLVFGLLIFMLPKIIMQDYGEDAPFGIYIAIAPICILIFLWVVTPLQNNYDPYDLILLGAAIATLGPIPMFFGMNIWDFLIFILIISFAEALYSPMLNVFTFNFTKPGREGTFLTLTAAPVYFTMAVTGLLGGYLLENYYPAEEDDTHKKRPWVIWLTIICISALSTIILFIFRRYFDCADEVDEEDDSIKSKMESNSKME
jgi:MFS family permease